MDIAIPTGKWLCPYPTKYGKDSEWPMFSGDVTFEVSSTHLQKPAKSKANSKVKQMDWRNEREGGRSETLINIVPLQTVSALHMIEPCSVRFQWALLWYMHAQRLDQVLYLMWYLFPEQPKLHLDSEVEVRWSCELVFLATSSCSRQHDNQVGAAR